MEQPQRIDRRPIAARGTGWARRIARFLADAGVRPNTISLFGVGITGLCAALLVVSREADGAVRSGLLLGAAACIPVRAGCNMFDGMVAVEFGKKTPSGDIFNELPDRISDGLMLIGAGYAIPDPDGAAYLGWAAALAALLTAYIRTLGAWAGAGQDFSGVMAKQQRMAVVMAACGISAVEGLWWDYGGAFIIALAVIIAGCAVTAGLRTLRIIRRLEAR